LTQQHLIFAVCFAGAFVSGWLAHVSRSFWIEDDVLLGRSERQRIYREGVQQGADLATAHYRRVIARLNRRVAILSFHAPPPSPAPRDGTQETQEITYDFSGMTPDGAA